MLLNIIIAYFGSPQCFKDGAYSFGHCTMPISYIDKIASAALTEVL